MNSVLEILKGVHPGLVVERELKKRALVRGKFAMSVDEYPQTFSSILKGKRKMNTCLAMKIEQALGLEEGFLMTLQVFYDIREEKKKLAQLHTPDLSKFRAAVFWDTPLDHIDWQRHSDFVIARIFERGNLREQKEVSKFYGLERIREVLNKNLHKNA